jgi:hypothetical protein
MAFIQPAYINMNTPYIREYLDKLNYKKDWFHLLPCYGIGTTIDDKGNGSYYGVADTIDRFPKSQFDCDENVDLFLAIAALKDNNDINQWMICTMEHTDPDNNTFYNVGDWRLSHRKKMKKIKRNDVWRKASLEELIQHFN